ncbi:hypothetical protein NODU109028_17400 [Nocardioides dubius]
MSATQLGAFFARGGAAMNLLLNDHGFIEGGPGAWRPTELGAPFATWVDKDNGYGGYAHRSWSWLSWSDDIRDALEASIKANPDGVLSTAAASAVVTGADAAVKSSGSGKGMWIVLGLTAAAAVPIIKYVQTKKSPAPEALTPAVTQGADSHEAPDATAVAPT